MQSPIFVQFIAKTTNITNVSLWDARMKATIELSNHQRKYRPPYSEALIYMILNQLTQ